MDRTLASATAQVAAASVPETLRRMVSLDLIVQSKLPFASLGSVVPTFVLMLRAEASTVGVDGVVVVPGLVAVVSLPFAGSFAFGSSPVFGSVVPPLFAFGSSVFVLLSSGVLTSSCTPGALPSSAGVIFATILSPKSDQLRSSSTTTSTAAIAPRTDCVCFLSETRRPPLCLLELYLILRGWSPSSQNGHLR